jgi:hypothetical protein
MKTLIKRDDLAKKFSKYISVTFKTQAEAAEHYKCAQSYIAAICNSKRPLNKQMLEELGYKKADYYEKSLSNT